MTAIVSFFLLVGCLIIFSAALGIVRFPTFYMRIHAVSQAPSLGVICIIFAAVLFFSITGYGFAGRAFLVFLFLYFTSALGTHMISKSFYHRYLEEEPLNSTPVAGSVEENYSSKEG